MEKGRQNYIKNIRKAEKKVGRDEIMEKKSSCLLLRWYIFSLL
jgi:hypothetical protein